MHICFVSREYPPNPMGGIGTYVANMTQILAASGVTVSVLTQDHQDAASHGYDAPVVSCDRRLRVHYLPFADANWVIDASVRNSDTDALARRDLPSAFGPVVCDALGKLLTSESLDAIEAPEYEAPLLFFQQKRATLPPSHPWQSVPTIVHLHSPSHMIFEHNDDPLTNPWVRARKANEALSIELADGVVSPSAFLAAQVSEWLNFDAGRVSVIPYPIGPLLKYCTDTKPVRGLCLFVGRVEPRKGVFEFVEAAVEVARKFPHATFRFVGGPHYRDGRANGVETASLIRECIPADLQSRFDFAGKVLRETLGEEYAHAAFVAVPSRWENYPNTCMEAMSCNRPVLASNQGGMPEMIEDESEGITVAGDTRKHLVANLKTGLEKMLQKSDDELAAMGEKSRTRILSICDDAEIVRRRTGYYKFLKDTARARCCGFTKASCSKVGAILFDDGATQNRITRALSAVDVQTADISLKALVATQNAAGWTMIPTDAEGRSAGLPTLKERLAALNNLPPVIYIGSADDILDPDALRQAANYFANNPDCGFCACWTRTNGGISAAFRNDALHLLAPAKFHERRFWNTRAIMECCGIIGSGLYLPDLMRDLSLRMLENGWRAGCIAKALVDVASREPAPVIKPFAFATRRDSIQAVALAHVSLVSKDTLAASEAMTQWAE